MQQLFLSDHETSKQHEILCVGSLSQYVTMNLNVSLLLNPRLESRRETTCPAGDRSQPETRSYWGEPSQRCTSELDTSPQWKGRGSSESSHLHSEHLGLTGGNQIVVLC